MSIENEYAMIIDIIANDGYNPKEIAVELAKINPTLFLRLVKRSYSIDKYREVATLMVNNQKVNAIKQLRDIEPLSLKEAKDIVDNVQDAICAKYAIDKLQPYSNDTVVAATLSYAHQKIADDIVSAVR